MFERVYVIILQKYGKIWLKFLDLHLNDEILHFDYGHLVFFNFEVNL